jgi:hypothetical protein
LVNANKIDALFSRTIPYNREPYLIELDGNRAIFVTGKSFYFCLENHVAFDSEIGQRLFRQALALNQREIKKLQYVEVEMIQESVNVLSKNTINYEVTGNYDYLRGYKKRSKKEEINGGC